MKWDDTKSEGFPDGKARMIRADAYRRALAFMNEKGLLEEFVDRETAAALGTNPLPDRAIIQPEGD